MSGIEILVGLLGGVVLLLWGLRMVRIGVSRAFILELRQLLGWSLGDRVRGFISGTVLAMCLQSGTATALLLASFIDTAGIPAATALAVVMGAELGSSLMARVLSLDISILTPILLLAGFILFQTMKQRRHHNVGRILFGLGLMLLALKWISEVAAVLGQANALKTLLVALSQEPALILLVAALLTWLFHSGIATVLLISSLASHGVMPVEAACLFVLGANVGANMPAIVGTLGSPPEVLRASVANIICRASGVVVLVPFLGIILHLLPYLGDDAAVQIVMFHVLLNFALGVFWLFLSAPVILLCQSLIPDRIPESDLSLRPAYLNKAALTSPAVALTNAVRETMRLGEHLETMVITLADALRSNDAEMAKRAGRMDKTIDLFYAAIRNYISEIDREFLSDEDARQSVEVMMFVSNLEHAGDIIELSLAPKAVAKIKNRLHFSAEEKEILEEFFQRIQSMMHSSFSVFQSKDIKTARQLLNDKTELRNRKDEITSTHMERLQQHGVGSSQASDSFLDALHGLHRIASHFASVAYPILQDAGELHQNRLRDRSYSSEYHIPET